MGEFHYVWPISHCQFHTMKSLIFALLVAGGAAAGDCSGSQGYSQGSNYFMPGDGQPGDDCCRICCQSFGFGSYVKEGGTGPGCRCSDGFSTDSSSWGYVAFECPKLTEGRNASLVPKRSYRVSDHLNRLQGPPRRGRIVSFGRSFLSYPPGGMYGSYVDSSDRLRVCDST